MRDEIKKFSTAVNHSTASARLKLVFSLLENKIIVWKRVSTSYAAEKRVGLLSFKMSVKKFA